MKRSGDLATLGDVWKMIKGFEMELIDAGRLPAPTSAPVEPTPVEGTPCA